MKGSIKATWRHRKATNPTDAIPRGSGGLSGVALAIFSALGAALPASLLYCGGRGERNAALFTWGIDPELLPLGRLETIYAGLGVGLTAALAAVGTLILLALYAIPMYVLNRYLSAKLQRKSETGATDAQNRSPAKRLPESLERGVGAVMFVGGASGLSVLCFFLFELYAQSSGASTARELRDAMTSCNAQTLSAPKYKPVVIERLTSGVSTHYSGFSITCASTGCAVYDPLRQAAQFVPRDGIVRFETTTVDRVCKPGAANLATPRGASS
ncbi:hypothetical protein K8353_01300 [Burkholderia contaminans]|nr:hypothetical protein [Burkholderia contaminans]